MVAPFPVPQPPGLGPVPPFPMGPASGGFPPQPGPPLGMAPMGMPPAGPPMPAGPAPQPGPPPVAPSPLADPTMLAATIASMTDQQLRAFLLKLGEEEKIAFLQLLESLAAPQILERIVGLMPPKRRKDPVPPRGYQKPSRPTWPRIRSFASTQEKAYAAFRDRVAFELQVVRSGMPGGRSGAFKSDEARILAGELEPFSSPALRNELELVVTTAATAPLTIKHHARHAGVRQESQQVEDTLRCWRTQNERRWSQNRKGLLPWAKAQILAATGLLVERVLIAPDDPYCPMRCDLLDPTTCYPKFDGRRGISAAVCRYDAVLADVAGDFGADLDDLITERTKQSKDVASRNETEDADAPWGTVVTVIDYWDREWRGVWLDDGTEVLPLDKHNYYEVPFVFTLGARSQPDFLANLAGTGQTTTRDGQGRLVQVNGDPTTLDPTAGVVSHVSGSIARHLQEEAVATKGYNRLSMIGEEPVAIFQDPLARTAHQNPTLDRRRKKISKFLTGEEIRPVSEPTDPAMLQVVLQRQGRDQATDLVPLARYGANPASQATGAAVQQLQDAGNDKFAWLVRSLEGHESNVFGLMLRLYERWGHLLGYAGERGSLTVPYAAHRRRKPGEDAYFTITPEVVSQAGCEVTVNLTDISRANLAALAGAGTALTQGQFVDRYWVQDELLNLPDPDEMQARIRLDQTMDDPALKKLAILRDIRTVYTLPDGSLDPEGEWMLRVIEREMGGTQQQGGGPQQPPMPGGPPGMGGPLTDGGPPMPNSSAMNLQNFNPNVGAGAGRPPGPTPLAIL